jgi:hypothetical protein
MNPEDRDLPVVDLAPTGDPLPRERKTVGNLHHVTYGSQTIAVAAESIWTVSASATAASRLADSMLILSFTAETPKKTT